MIPAWIDIYDASGNRLGPGPLRKGLYRVSITREMDGAGGISFAGSVTNERFDDLVQNERRAYLYAYDGNQSTPIRLLGRGVVTRRAAEEGPGVYGLNADGPDILHELKSISTGRALKYDNQQVQTIISGLIGKVSGWSSSSSVTDTTSVRFDGESIYKAIQAICQQQGLHFREASVGTLEVGAFGSDSGLRCVQRTNITQGLRDNDDVALIDTISVIDESEALVNRIEGYFGGIGEATFGLGEATKSSPYAVESMTRNGRTVYYIEDASSVSSYGLKEKVLNVSHIVPLDTTPTDITRAADAAYDYYANMLQRGKDPQTTLQLRLRKVRKNVKPGDKVHVRYKGLIRDENGDVVDYRSINGDYWVIGVTESLNTSGYSTVLRVSNVDRHQENLAEEIVGRLDQAEIDMTRQKSYFSHDTDNNTRLINDSLSATFFVDYSDAVQGVQRATIRLKTRPLRSTLSNTLMAESPGTVPNGPWYWRSVNMYDDVSGGIVNVLLPVDVESNPLSLRSNVSSVSSFEISDDSKHPANVRISINGTDRTTVLGGPWGGISTAVDVELDITSILEGDGVQQLHEIVISCDSGQGEIELVKENYVKIASLERT